MSILTELDSGIYSSVEADTSAVAERLAAELPPDSTLALIGELGAGKTTFVRGLASAWGVREPVTSPTFNMCSLHRGERLLVHVDAYRLTNAGEWDGLMIEDFLVTPWCLAIEWPERIADRIPRQALWLQFEMKSADSRVIRRVDSASVAWM